MENDENVANISQYTVGCLTRMLNHVECLLNLLFFDKKRGCFDQHWDSETHDWDLQPKVRMLNLYMYIYMLDSISLEL